MVDYWGYEKSYQNKADVHNDRKKNRTVPKLLEKLKFDEFVIHRVLLGAPEIWDVAMRDGIKLFGTTKATDNLSFYVHFERVYDPEVGNPESWDDAKSEYDLKLANKLDYKIIYNTVFGIYNEKAEFEDFNEIGFVNIGWDTFSKMPEFQDGEALSKGQIGVVLKKDLKEWLEATLEQEKEVVEHKKKGKRTVPVTKKIVEKVPIVDLPDLIRDISKNANLNERIPLFYYNKNSRFTIDEFDKYKKSIKTKSKSKTTRNSRRTTRNHDASTRTPKEIPSKRLKVKAKETRETKENETENESENENENENNREDSPFVPQSQRSTNKRGRSGASRKKAVMLFVFVFLFIHFY